MIVERIGAATLYCGDCREVLPTLGKFEAVVTDPPYGIGFAAEPTKWQRRAGLTGQSWDDDAPSLGHVLELAPTLAIWGGNYYPLPISRGWLSWFKPDAPPSMGSFELAWTNLNRNCRQISHSISATNPERCGHPTQKPLAVMRWCIDQIGTPRSIIDPYMGSGSTGVAAVQMGLTFVGIELDARYFDLACERIDNAQRQAVLL